MNIPLFKQNKTAEENSADFISQVWTYFGLALAVASLGAYAGMPILAKTGIWVPYGAFMALMFTQNMWSDSKKFGPIMFFVFAFVSGIILAPTLAFADATGQIDKVIQAISVASGTFFLTALFGYTTKKDLSGWGQFLFMGMIGLFVIGLMSMAGNMFDISFLQFGDTFSYIYSIASILIFAAYTSYDLQNIKKGHYSSPILAATHLYINMFAIIQSMMSLFLDRE